MAWALTTDSLVVQAIDRAAAAIAYVAQPDSTVLSRRRREESKLEAKLRAALPIVLEACIADINTDIRLATQRASQRARPRRTFVRKGTNNNADDMTDLLSAYGALGIKPGDHYVIQRIEDA